MKRLSLFGLLAGFCLAIVPAALNAGPFQTVPFEPQPRPELYVFGYGGIDWMNDFHGKSETGNPNLNLDVQNGWGAGGGLGLRSDWLGGTRFEVEGLYRANNVKHVQVNGLDFPSDGDVSVTGVSVNFIKELVLGDFYPYVGVGIGWGDVNVNAPFAFGNVDDDASSFLWQVIAGLDFPWTKKTSLFMEYRFMPVTSFGLTTDVASVIRNVNFDDLTNHSLFFGMRYAF